MGEDNKPLFAEIKAGDSVILHPAGFYDRVRRVCAVQKVTATQVMVNGIRYRRDIGRQIGGSRFHASRIQPATDALIAEVSRESRRHDLVRKMADVRWSELPLETLEKINACLP